MELLCLGTPEISLKLRTSLESRQLVLPQILGLCTFEMRTLKITYILVPEMRTPLGLLPVPRVSGIERFHHRQM